MRASTSFKTWSTNSSNCSRFRCAWSHGPLLALFEKIFQPSCIVGSSITCIVTICEITVLTPIFFVRTNSSNCRRSQFHVVSDEMLRRKIMYRYLEMKVCVVRCLCDAVGECPSGCEVFMRVFLTLHDCQTISKYVAIWLYGSWDTFNVFFASTRFL